MGRILLSDYDIARLWSTVLNPRPPWMDRYKGLCISGDEIQSPEEQHAELGLLVGIDEKEN